MAASDKTRVRVVLMCLALAACGGGCTKALMIEPQPVCNFDALMAQRQAPRAPAEAPRAASAVLTEMPLDAVNLTDFAITNKIMVESAHVRRTPAGSVEVSARLVNCTDFPLQIEGRTHFLDEERAPAEDVSAWNRVFLPPRSYGVYTESSTNVGKVRYYYVEVREGR